jgi:hypothetical protein
MQISLLQRGAVRPGGAPEHGNGIDVPHDRHRLGLDLPEPSASLSTYAPQPSTFSSVSVSAF